MKTRREKVKEENDIPKRWEKVKAENEDEGEDDHEEK